MDCQSLAHADTRMLPPVAIKGLSPEDRLEHVVAHIEAIAARPTLLDSRLIWG